MRIIYKDNEAEVLDTGDVQMTVQQESYLGTLAREAGEEPPTDLTKAEAAKKIEELQEETGRGR